MKELDRVTVCIYCSKPLSKWEGTRSYCWDCSEMTASEAYNDSKCSYENVDGENTNSDNWYDLVF